MIELRGVGFSYPGRVVFEGLDLVLPKGGRLALVGRSGSGKTTLLHLMAGLLRPDSGRVLMDGEPMDPSRHGVSVIMQDYGLFPWMTVERNTGLGLSLKGVGGADLRDACRMALDAVGLSGFGREYPGRLSGGQRQRVAIARALARDSRCLLMDEPFNALDAFTREELQDLVLRLCETRGLTMAMVTHDVGEAVRMGGEILVLGGDPPGIRRITRLPNPWSGAGHSRFDPGVAEMVAAVRDLL